MDASVESECAFRQTEHRYDLFFAGGDSPERTPLLESLEAQHARCGFFGFGGRPALNGRQLAAAISQSKVGLNISRLADVPMYSSDRLAQLVGNGCLVMTPRTPGMLGLFSEQEVAYYDSEESLREQIAFYLKDDTAWRAIAERGHQRAHQCYNEKRVTQFMLEAMTAPDSANAYEWVSKYGRLLLCD